ncbi:alpha/beta hydrolase [Haloferula sp. BvORR071]|uniref:esterase/lipase family protein n=1 Tax=Haloferula sp. BvORR071 TaxID=1396141 RepID=UPI0005514865|nr:alpha/beta hydrolase [Haloferula sp. BvORR071]
MRRLATIALTILSLAVTACVPAKLERLVEKRRAPHTAVETDEDLARAFDGASDEAATRCLGRWIEEQYAKGVTAAAVQVGSHRVHFHPGGEGIFAPGYFDKLECVDHFRVVGLKDHHIDGVGAVMTGHRENKHTEPVEQWYPPEAITRAVTAVAVPGAPRGGIREVEIRLYNRMKTESVVLAAKRQTLAADFTVPFASLLANTRSLARSGLTSVLQQDTGKKTGFYMTEEYDPHRTPLIMIHGLFSTPLAWAELTNELRADPAIRQRYQIWHYLYPTNAPPLYSARIMRLQLDEFRRFLDPEGDDPAMQRTVVVAHSMGGLLAKSLVVDPQEAFWNPIFTLPLAKMNLTKDERAMMKEAFYWKPRKHVDRIIFCSTPFAGSTWAASWVGSFGKLLVARSHGFTDFFEEIERKNPGMWQPAYNSTSDGTVNSILSLKPKQRSMEIFRQLPVVPTTATHVIKGQRDLFVSPESADIAGAESTLTVPSGHGSFHHPQAIAEIKRILALPAAH